MGERRISENSDGSAIFHLERPIKVNGEELERVTIPAITGRHLRKCTWPTDGSNPSIGDLIEWAALIVLPLGAVDEMTPSDAMAVATRVALSLGKSPPPGAANSP